MNTMLIFFKIIIIMFLSTICLVAHAEQTDRSTEHAQKNHAIDHQTKKKLGKKTKDHVVKTKSNMVVQKKNDKFSKKSQEKSSHLTIKKTKGSFAKPTKTSIHAKKSASRSLPHNKRPVTITRSSSAKTALIPINELVDFKNYPIEVKQLILAANNLSKQNLTYLFGSADPKNKGMDCSGTIKYLLKQQNVTSPRQTHEIYMWLEREGELHQIKRNLFFTKDKLDKLKPGDLLFWKNTYKVNRTPPITHVMLYLGKNKKNQPLMFGASNGGVYNQKSMYGVSVFNFNYPKVDTGKFVGYGCIPRVTCESKWG